MESKPKKRFNKKASKPTSSEQIGRKKIKIEGSPKSNVPFSSVEDENEVNKMTKGLHYWHSRIPKMDKKALDRICSNLEDLCHYFALENILGNSYCESDKHFREIDEIIYKLEYWTSELNIKVLVDSDILKYLKFLRVILGDNESSKLQVLIIKVD